MLRAELKVAAGKHAGQVIPLNRRKFLIGREQDCQLRPNSDLVSRHHCVFNVDEYSVRLRDLGSTNGTVVNGERIRQEVLLKTGDRVVVGSLEFEVVVHEAATTEATVEVGENTLAEVAQVKPAAEAEPVEQSAPAEAVLAAPAATAASEVTGGDSAAPAVDAAPAEQTPPAQQPQQPEGQPGIPVMPSASSGDTTVLNQTMMLPNQIPYQQMMGQMGYPGMYPGFGVPGGMGMYPQFGQMPYGAMPQGVPQQAPASPAAEPEADSGETQQAAQEVTLPDPSETGVKESPAPAPPAPEPKAEGGEQPAPPPKSDDSYSAADSIIKGYMKRR